MIIAVPKVENWNCMLKNITFNIAKRPEKKNKLSKQELLVEGTLNKYVDRE